MYTKVQIYNLALGALLLDYQIADPESDKSKQCKVLNLHFPTALSQVLQDLDLDSTSEREALELIEENPNDEWLYAYKYPTKCAFLRRIVSGFRKDNRTTSIPKATGTLNGVKVIYTDEPNAKAEYIHTDLNLNSLNPSALLALAYWLAFLSSSLIVGKGALNIKKSVMADYGLFKIQAQKHDRMESDTFEDLAIDSEFVEARTS